MRGSVCGTTALIGEAEPPTPAGTEDGGDWVKAYRREHPDRPPINPRACAWRDCDFIADTVAQRNEHVLHLCEHRGQPVKEIDGRTRGAKRGALTGDPRLTVGKGRLLGDPRLRAGGRQAAAIRITCGIDGCTMVSTRGAIANHRRARHKDKDIAQ